MRSSSGFRLLIFFAAALDLAARCSAWRSSPD
jgi:hypothetical protein